MQISMDNNFEQARTHFTEGLAHYQAGRYAQAEQGFAAALALVPGRPSALTNLGATRLKLGRAADAIAALDEALAQEPGNVEALSHKATALAELGRLEESLAAFDDSLAREPRQGLAWSHRGNVLRELGRREEAVASFREALARDADRELTLYNLASMGAGKTPPRPPQGYVEALFDHYAEQFDEQLPQLLRYDAPGVIAENIAGLGRGFERALDLGCGTGLCGPLLKPHCGALDGVDLSGAMLAKARALGCYDELHQVDLCDWLAKTPQRHELVVAADVFVYLGELAAAFAGVARVLRPGGLFFFTVEAAEAGDVVLRPSLRYAHAEAYVRRLAQQNGMRVEQAEHRPVREDQGMPIAGVFFRLAR